MKRLKNRNLRTQRIHLRLDIVFMLFLSPTFTTKIYGASVWTSRLICAENGMLSYENKNNKCTRKE